MQRHFEIELEELRGRVLEMGRLVQRAIHLSVESLHDANIELAGEASNEIIERIEPRVNDLHREIDKRALDLIALQQVMAVDLRFVTAASRIGSDLERMSDRAVNIARRTISILTNPNPKSVIHIPKMAETVEGMVHDSIAHLSVAMKYWHVRYCTGIGRWMSIAMWCSRNLSMKSPRRLDSSSRRSI